MTRCERYLTILLRVIGGMSLLALVAVFVPRAWMVWCHETLPGLGAFPDAPVTEYLARSTSLFYALWGGVLWWLSLDVRRYGRLISVVGVGATACGMILLSIDMRAAMPWWWTVGEGPFVVAMGIAILLLQMRARGEAHAAEGGGTAEEGERPANGDNEPDADAPADT